MPRKKPNAGASTFDAQDQQHHSEVVAAAIKEPKQLQQKSKTGAAPENAERKQQIRANAPATSDLANAIRGWHDNLPPEMRRLTSASSKFSAFIADNDENLTKLFLEYIK